MFLHFLGFFYILLLLIHELWEPNGCLVLKMDSNVNYGFLFISPPPQFDSPLGA